MASYPDTQLLTEEPHDDWKSVLVLSHWQVGSVDVQVKAILLANLTIPIDIKILV